MLVAAGLHGLFLLLPVRSINQPPPVSEQPIKVVKLKQRRSPKLLAKNPATASLKVAPKPKPVTQTVTTKRVSTPQPSSLPVKPPAKPPVQPPTTEQPTPADRKQQPKPANSKPRTLGAKQSPQQPQTKQLNQSKQSQKADPPTDDSTELAELAPEIGAKETCNDAKENCWRVEDSQWRSVSANLTKALEQTGHKVSQVDDSEEDTGMKIFEVSKNDQTYYLYFLSLSSGNGGTAYFQASSKDLSLEQAEQRVQGKNT